MRICLDKKKNSDLLNQAKILCCIFSKYPYKPAIKALNRRRSSATYSRANNRFIE